MGSALGITVVEERNVLSANFERQLQVLQDGYHQAQLQMQKVGMESCKAEVVSKWCRNRGEGQLLATI